MKCIIFVYRCLQIVDFYLFGVFFVFLTKQNKKMTHNRKHVIQQRAIFAFTIVAAEVLNFCDRDGNRCVHFAIATGPLRSIPQNQITCQTSFDQVLGLLVSVNSMHHCTSIPDLSTSSSSRGLTSEEWQISSWRGLRA